LSVSFLRNILGKAARSEAHEQLAAERGLSYEAIGTVPEATPLLRAAMAANFTSVMRGPIADGIEGSAAMMTHSEPHPTRDGDTVHAIHQVALAGVAQGDFIPLLVVGSRSVWEPPRREDLREIDTESIAVAEEYKLQIGSETSENRVRQLLSPTMLDWLAGIDVPGFGFELEAGWLCAYSRPSGVVGFGRKGDPAELAWLMDTTGSLAERIVAEAAE
jgi:hypothetical protein